MSIIIKRNYLFFVDKEKLNPNSDIKEYKADGKLRLRIRYSSGKVDFNVGYRVKLEKWNTETQRCTSSSVHGKQKISAFEINQEIQRLATLADNVFKSFEIADHLPTVEEYRNAFNMANDIDTGKESSKKNKYPFFQMFDEFVIERGIKNDWTASTYEKFASVKNHLLAFDKDVQFDDWDEEKLTDYVNYFRTKKQMRNSTIDNQLDFLRWFLRWGIEKGYSNNRAFETFKPKLKTTQKKVIFLSWNELNQLKDYVIPESKKYLDRVRDVFLFQCYTGLRYSDVFNLKRSDIKDNHIEVTTVKTADSLIIDLNDYSRAILDKYKNIHFESNKALPVISNQKTNDYLKELGELAEINEPVRETYYKGNDRIDEVYPKYELLGTHAGRRTFICNALSMGTPAHVVMRLTGHSDYKAMKPYIDIADEDRKKAMNIWNQREKKETEKEKLLEQLKELDKDVLAEMLALLNNK